APSKIRAVAGHLPLCSSRRGFRHSYCNSTTVMLHNCRMRPDSLWNTARVDTPERHACWYKSIQSDNQQQNRQWRMRCTVEFENIDLDAILQEIEASGLSVSQGGDGLSDTDIASYRELVAGAGERVSALEDLNIGLLDRSTGAGSVLRNRAQSRKGDTAAASD